MSCAGVRVRLAGLRPGAPGGNPAASAVKEGTRPTESIVRSRQQCGKAVMPTTFSHPPSRTVRNRLLRLLPPAELERLRPRLEPVELAVRTVLLMPGASVESVHFLETGTISMIATLEDGTQVEVGLVGPEGMAGLPLLLGSATSPIEGMVQVAGTALRMPAAAFRAALAEAPSLLGLLLRYVDAFHLQVAQTAACNSRHHIEQRLARWLLMTHDRVDGDSFHMTQEFMSAMLGVRRPGVTLAIGALQRAGLVQHGNSSVQVLNRPGLEAASCECYEAARRRFDWLMTQS